MATPNTGLPASHGVQTDPATAAKVAALVRAEGLAPVARKLHVTRTAVAAIAIGGVVKRGTLVLVQLALEAENEGPDHAA